MVAKAEKVTKFTTISVKPETQRKLRSIASAQRRTMVETIDILADREIERMRADSTAK